MLVSCCPVGSSSLLGRGCLGRPVKRCERAARSSRRSIRIFTIPGRSRLLRQWGDENGQDGWNPLPRRSSGRSRPMPCGVLLVHGSGAKDLTQSIARIGSASGGDPCARRQASCPSQRSWSMARVSGQAFRQCSGAAGTSSPPGRIPVAEVLASRTVKHRRRYRSK